MNLEPNNDFKIDVDIPQKNINCNYLIIVYSMKIRSIKISNFKSLKNININFLDYNVIVGPNGSGKSNFIEAFELLKSIYLEKSQNPFLKWWGYDHVVWNKDENLNIIFELKFELMNRLVDFYTEFSGIGGSFQIVREKICIENVITIEQNQQETIFNYDEDYYKDLSKSKEIEGVLKQFNTHNSAFRKETETKDEDIKSIKEKIFLKKYVLRNDIRNFVNNNIFEQLNDIFRNTGSYFVSSDYSYYDLKINEENNNFIIIILPNFRSDKNNYEINKLYKNFNNRINILGYFILNFHNFLNSPLLKRLNFEKMKNPFRVSNDLKINDDGSNFGSVLYNLFLKENKVPRIVETFITEIFKDNILRFQPTADGRIFISLKSGEVEFFPPGLSDGFFKILTLATAIELQSEIIFVDEIEDSLYAKVSQFFISIAKENNIQLIITTHSPYIVDISDPKDLLIFQNEDNITSVKKYKSPEEIRKQLNKMNVTLSERWLYGSDKDLE